MFKTIFTLLFITFYISGCMVYIPGPNGSAWHYVDIGTKEQVKENLSDFGTAAGEVTKVAVESGALEQGTKEYYAMKRQQQVDKVRSDRAYAELMRSPKRSARRNQDPAAIAVSSSLGVRSSYSGTASDAEEKQMRECTIYRVKSRWTVVDGEVNDPNTANFYEQKSLGSKISCHYLAECTLYKVGYKNYTHTVNDRTKQMQINYAVIKQVQQLEQSDTCRIDCAEGVCDSPSGVDNYIDRNYYDKTFNSGSSIEQ